MSILTHSIPSALTSSFETEMLERLQTAMADRESLASNSWLRDTLEALVSVVDYALDQTSDDSQSHFEPTRRSGVIAETRPGTWGGSVRLREVDAREIESEYQRLNRVWKHLKIRLLILQEIAAEQVAYDPVSLSERCEVVGWIRDWHEYRAAVQKNSHVERALLANSRCE